MKKQLSIKYDPDTDIATIEGIKFHGDLLRAFAGYFPDDRSYRVVKDGDVVRITETRDSPKS